MPSSFVVYIDESGDEGFDFSKPTPHWFVLSGVVFRTNSEPQDVQLVDVVAAKIGRTGDLHFNKLNHDQRVVYSEAIGKASVRCVSVVVHKPSILEPERFKDRRLYHYAVRYLLERVSWLCADTARKGEGDGRADLVFSHRRQLSYRDISTYLERLSGMGTSIDWSVIDPQSVRSVPHRNRKGLWIADAVAGSVYAAFCGHAKYGHTETRYLENLRWVTWRKKGVYRGHGIKLWPPECVRSLDLANRHRLAADWGLAQ